MSAGRILVAEDSTVIRTLLAAQLTRQGYEVVAVADGNAALAAARTAPPDVILCDVEMPNLDGYGVLAEIERSPELATIPVVFLTARTDSADVAEALRRGAYDYLRKPFESVELVARVHAAMRTKGLQDALRLQNLELERLSVTDPLTGLHNRRFLATQLQRSASRARRHGSELAVVMLDIDFFKRINDTHGHATGDAVLVAIAKRLQGRLRAEDLLGRWGGEEFLALLQDVDVEAVDTVASALCGVVRHEPVMHGGRAVRVTVSVGWATWNHAGDDVEALVRLADDALYRAKQSGRDRACGPIALARA